MVRVGVLALQGDFSKHIHMLRSLGVEVQEVRKPQELETCDGLIIPGGESTVMMRQIDFIKMREPLLNFAKEKPLFGTCAGLIIMSKHVRGDPFQPLPILDIEVERNAFGRQVDSFQSNISFQTHSLPAFFIRAPRIRHSGKDVEILATLENEPILIQQGSHLGATFHPELTSNSFIHQYFISLIEAA